MRPDLAAQPPGRGGGPEPAGEPAGLAPGRPYRGLARLAVAAIWLSVALMFCCGLLGPSAAVARIPAAPPWPPYFAHARPGEAVAALLMWAAVLAGFLGVTCGLVALRRGWRPRPRRLIAGSAIAVAALVLVPPVGSNDMLDYVVYGRIEALGHNPYQMTPAQLRRSGDPIGLVAPRKWQYGPSVYGPLATQAQRAASELAGPSAARTVFWLKVWNGLAYLAVVLALDRAAGSAPDRRRAHLLWSVNPLMLLAVVAGGHVDGLAAAAGAAGLLALRRLEVKYGLLAGVLAAAAAAVKAPFALFGAGLVIAARRSAGTLAALALGAVAVLVPGYLLTGHRSLSAIAGAAYGKTDLYGPWQLLFRTFGLTLTSQRVDVLGLIAFVPLAALLLWRLPDGPPGRLAVRPALALTLAWLVTTSQQQPWFDAMIFPLLAIMPASQLDWIALSRSAVAALAGLPGVIVYFRLRPHWLAETADIITHAIAPLGLFAAAIALIWCCLRRRWELSPVGRTAPAGTAEPTGAAGPAGTAGPAGEADPAGEAEPGRRRMGQASGTGARRTS